MLHSFLRSSDWSFRNSVMCLNLLHHLADIRDLDSRWRFTSEAVSPLSSFCNIKQMKSIFGRTASLYSSSCLKCDSHSHRSSLTLCVGDEGDEETMIVNISLWSRIQTDNDIQLRSMNGEVVVFSFLSAETLTDSARKLFLWSCYLSGESLLSMHRCFSLTSWTPASTTAVWG